MTQVDRLYELLKDYRPHSTDEILRVVYGGSHLGVARISGRVFDTKRKYGVKIDCFRDKERDAIYWYQMKRPLDNQELFSMEKSYKNVL